MDSSVTGPNLPSQPWPVSFPAAPRKIAHSGPQGQTEREMCIRDRYGNPKLVAHPKDAELYQGDIYTEIPFLYTNENGEQTCIMRKAQLLTNTCDAVRDDNLIFAAIHPCEEFSKTAKDLVSIKGNHTFRLFYIPDPETQDLLIDFSLLTTLSRNTFLSLLQKGIVHRIAALSQIGYYMFICKLTVFFMRPEDVQVNKDRDTWG